MRQLVRVSMTFVVCAMAVWSQEYYEASGQTQVFTLAAGTKAGSTVIMSSPVCRSVINLDVSVATSRGGITVALPYLYPGSADVSLYDIKGRRVFRQSGLRGTLLRLEIKAFSPGVYSMVVHVDGKKYARRIAINGRSE